MRGSPNDIFRTHHVIATTIFLYGGVAVGTLHVVEGGGGEL